MSKLLYVGIDVDDKNFHISGFCKQTGEVHSGICKPNAGALIKSLNKLEKLGFKLKTCYEATYLGYSLHRQLVSAGVENQIVAPSLIPKLSSDFVKTDRIDSAKLAKYLANDLLTKVFVPDEEDEADRDLVRSRSFVVKQRSDLKRHILSTCRRLGLDYKSDTKGKYHWTKSHIEWLGLQLKTLHGATRFNLQSLLEQYDWISDQIIRYDEEILALATSQKYEKKVSTLCCFRGISTLSAMTLITEIGDIKRFSHPRKLTSYAGMDIREYSSGGKELKFGITKMGNRRIRTVVVEACQRTDFSSYLSRRLKVARQGQPKQIVQIAEKCEKRLKKRAEHLIQKNKHRNKVKVACARELLNFTWEALIATV